MLSVALFAAAAFTPAVPATISLADVDGAEAMGLAKVMLPETISLQVVNGDVHRLWYPFRSHQIRWWTAPRFSGGLCERSLYWIDANNRSLHGDAAPPGASLTVEPHQQRLQFAFPGAKGCETPSGYISPLAGETAAAIEALELLASALDMARAAQPLPFEVTCKEDEERKGRCTNPRAALVQLPLSTMFGVNFETGRYERMAGMAPNIRRQLPATAEFPAVPTVRFGPSADDDLTWSATLHVKDGQIVAVHLGRTFVSSH